MADNITVANRLLNEVWTGRSAQVLDELCAPDCRFIDPLLSLFHPDLDPKGADLAQYKSIMARFDRSFDVMTVVVNEQLAIGDTMLCRWTMRARMAGDFLGFEASGGDGYVHGLALLRFRDGKLVEHEARWDVLNLLKEVDALTIAEPPRAREAEGLRYTPI